MSQLLLSLSRSGARAGQWVVRAVRGIVLERCQLEPLPQTNPRNTRREVVGWTHAGYQVCKKNKSFIVLLRRLSLVRRPLGEDGVDRRFRITIAWLGFLPVSEPALLRSGWSCGPICDAGNDPIRCPSLQIDLSIWK